MSRPLAILTGASSGIGAALAPLLARDGYDLLLVARREAQLEDVSRRVAAAVPGARAEAFALDLTAPDAAARLLARAPEAALLVNNAGMGYAGDALALPIEGCLRLIQLNATALAELTLRFARAMAERGGGTILNVASSAAFQPMPWATLYSATKAFVVTLSEALDFEVRGRGVRVLVLCPGPTLTEFGAHAGVAREREEAASLFYQSAEQVAACAARQIRRRRGVVVSGVLNALAAVLAQIGPRRAARYFASYVFGRGSRPPAPKPPAGG